MQEIDGAASAEFVGNHFLHGRDELPHSVAAIDGACIMHDFAEPLKFLGGKFFPISGAGCEWEHPRP